MRYRNSAVAARFAFSMALLAGATPFCTAQVKAPPVGIARLGDGTVRALYGLPENLIVDPRSHGSFDAASFSDQTGLIANDGQIRLVDANFTVLGEFDTGEPQPLLNVDGGPGSAVAWLPAGQALLYWTKDGFFLRTVNGLDHSLRATGLRRQCGNSAQMLLTSPDGSVFEAAISLESGNVISLKAVPGVRGSAFWQGATILFDNTDGLQASMSNGETRTIAPSPGDLSFAHISSKWVLVTSASTNRSWALHANGTDLHLSEVPGLTKQLEAAK